MDKKAKQILYKYYWKNGWLDENERLITEEDYNLFIIREHPPLESSSVFKDYRCQSLNSLKSCISHYNLRFNINSSEIKIGYIFRDKFGILFQVVYK